MGFCSIYANEISALYLQNVSSVKCKSEMNSSGLLLFLQ